MWVRILSRKTCVKHNYLLCESRRRGKGAAELKQAHTPVAFGHTSWKEAALTEGQHRGERRECSMARGICALVKRVFFFSLFFLSATSPCFVDQIENGKWFAHFPRLIGDLHLRRQRSRGDTVPCLCVSVCVGGSVSISIECSLPFLLLPLLYSHPFGSWVHVALSWQNTNVRNKRKSWRQKRKGS